MITQKEWKVISCGTYEDIIIEAGDKSVAGVHNHSATIENTDVAVKEAEDNARLIAASPLLLEACKNLVRGQLQHPSFEAYVKHAVWVAEQAIAKAENTNL